MGGGHELNRRGCENGAVFHAVFLDKILAIVAIFLAVFPGVSSNYWPFLTYLTNGKHFDNIWRFQPPMCDISLNLAQDTSKILKFALCENGAVPWHDTE